MFNDDINYKISSSIGKRKKHHMSETIDAPNAPMILRIPGRRGFFNPTAIKSLPDNSIFEVYCERRYVGIMSKLAIREKFGNV